MSNLTFSFDSKLGHKLLNIVSGYNHNKYWKRRKYIVDSTNEGFLLKKLYYLFWIKRIDSKKLCSFGTNLNSGAIFKEPPHLPHGPNGIIVGHDVIIGKNVTIFQQVTIAHGGVEIGDNVIIGAGAKILPCCRIGHDCKIGANAVVVQDIPAYSTVINQKPRVIIRNT